jgi:poly(3-hydroxybutyrate) depolymerase
MTNASFRKTFSRSTVFYSRHLTSCAAIILVLGCSDDTTGGAPESAGAPTTGGRAGGGASSSDGGASGGTAGRGLGGTASGGLASTAGSASAGATSGGSGGQGAGGSASGSGAGGSAGTSGAAGAAGSASTGGSAAVGSEGCGKSGRPTGGVVTVSGDHIYNFPASYDGNKPFPLLIGFHAAGNPIDQIQTLTKGSAFETDYVRAFPKSAGNEWVYNTDLNKAFKVYDELMSTYCIDKSRVFATGHSSGAQMIVQILVHDDAAKHFAFKAVAPVAASNYGAIASPIPVMYIQGKMDNQRGNDGAEVVARFTAVNKCQSMSSAYASVASCSSTQNGSKVEPGCISYAGCSEPTIWCSHNDPNYSSTNHGWPCFATKAMYDFFASLP